MSRQRFSTGENRFGNTYNISGPESLSLEEVARRLSVITGKKISYRDASQIEFLKTLNRLRMPSWYAQAVSAAWEVAKQGQPLVTGVVAELTNKQPRTFERFAHDYATYFT